MTSGRWAKFKRWILIRLRREEIWRRSLREGRQLAVEGKYSEAAKRYGEAFEIAFEPFFKVRKKLFRFKRKKLRHAEPLMEAISTELGLITEPSVQDIPYRRLAALVLWEKLKQWKQHLGPRVRAVMSSHIATLLEQAIAINTPRRQLRHVSSDYLTLAEIADSEGQYRIQRECLEQVLTLAQERTTEQAVRDVMHATLSLSQLYLSLGSLPRAQMYAEQSQRIAQELKQQRTEAAALWIQALVAARQGREEATQILRTEILTIARQQGEECANGWNKFIKQQLKHVARVRQELAHPLEVDPYARNRPYPQHRQDSGYWDHFWHKVEYLNHWMDADLFDKSDEVIPALQQRSCEHILLVGNGVSIEPRALAQAGFRTTALDLSPHATEIAASTELTEELLRSYSYFRKLPEVVIDEQRDREVVFVTGSLFDQTLCPGPFDCIIIRRTMQYFHGQDLGLALDALLARLSPTGVLIIHAHNANPFISLLPLQERGISASYASDIPLILEVLPDQQVACVYGTSG